MRPSTFVPISTTNVTPTTTSDIKSAKAPVAAAAVLISTETTDARVTFDGTDPSAGTGSHKIPKDQAPVLLLLGQGVTVKAVSTAAANSIVQLTWLQ